MTRRVVVEEPCEHGEVDDCQRWVSGTVDVCPGGSRRVLSDALVVERDADGEWPEWVNKYRLRVGGTTSDLLDVLASADWETGDTGGEE